jgi:hypothetical protein
VGCICESGENGENGENGKRWGREEEEMGKREIESGCNGMKFASAIEFLIKC